MTDNEIIKALEPCRGLRLTTVKMFVVKEVGKVEEVKNELYIGEILDLINRQKAEIERLNKEVDRLSQCVLYHEGHISDVIKEFAERLKAHFRKLPQWLCRRENYNNVGFSYDDVFYGISTVAKEMKGGKDDVV